MDIIILYPFSHAFFRTSLCVLHMHIELDFVTHMLLFHLTKYYYHPPPLELREFVHTTK
jgi:hypothetical protein